MQLGKKKLRTFQLNTFVVVMDSADWNWTAYADLILSSPKRARSEIGSRMDGLGRRLPQTHHTPAQWNYFIPPPHPTFLPPSHLTPLQPLPHLHPHHAPTYMYALPSFTPHPPPSTFHTPPSTFYPPSSTLSSMLHPPPSTLYPPSSTPHPPPPSPSTPHSSYLSGNQWSCVSVSTHSRLVLDLVVMDMRTMLRPKATNLL